MATSLAPRDINLCILPLPPNILSLPLSLSPSLSLSLSLSVFHLISEITKMFSENTKSLLQAKATWHLNPFPKWHHKFF